jgi:hypothetical protein
VPGALPAYLSNGVIGLRVGQLPLSSSVAMISGFAGVDPQTGVESFAPAPYPVAGDVVVGVYAARLGDRTRARDLLQRGYADFVTEPFTVTLEYEPTHFPEMTPAGPFTANLGGFLMALLYGLPDLQPDADDPAGWPKRRVRPTNRLGCTRGRTRLGTRPTDDAPGPARRIHKPASKPRLRPPGRGEP